MTEATLGKALYEARRRDMEKEEKERKEAIRERLEALALGNGGMSQLSPEMLGVAAAGLEYNGGLIFKDCLQELLNQYNEYWEQGGEGLSEEEMATAVSAYRRRWR